MRIALFITCLTDTFYPRAGVAIVRILEHLGYHVEFPAEQTCCGQPMFNSGYREDARRLAARMIEVFEPFGTVITPSGSCAAMIRLHYPELLKNDLAMAPKAGALAGRTYEFIEFLTDVQGLSLAEMGLQWEGAAAVHDSCHGREIGLAGRAGHSLRHIHGLKLCQTANAEQCCGFGGAFAVKYPVISGQMVADKADAIAGSGARTLVCGDAGCAMNIEGACRRRKVPIRVVSAAEIIAEALGLLPRGMEA